MQLFFELILRVRVAVAFTLFSLAILLNGTVTAQELTPREFFGDSYDDAVNYCESQKKGIASLLSGYGISSEEAVSIVFPEIIRYHRFRDFAETLALEVAYVRGGKGLADFSIGRFQMKPSFVEFIEYDLLNYRDLLLLFNDIVTYSSGSTGDSIRSERVGRLKQETWQLKYLACFIQLSEKHFARELNEKPEERLLILSSAYNKGLKSSYNELKALSATKTFPYGTTKSGRFSYYDVARYFSAHDAKRTLKPTL